jgi:hypothetical protein
MSGLCRPLGREKFGDGVGTVWFTVLGSLECFIDLFVDVLAGPIYTFRLSRLA